MDDIYHNKILIMNRTQIYIKVWIMIMLLFLSIFILFGFFHPINTYKTYLGYVRKDVDSYVVLYLKDFEIPTFKAVSILNNIEIINISEEYYLINDSNYYMVSIKTNLKKEDLINNNIINVIIKYPPTTLFKSLKKGLV